MGFVSLPHLVEELVEETQVMGDAKQGQRRRHQEHSQGAAHSGEEIHGDAERGAWGGGDKPKVAPKLHWGPLWGLVSPDGDGTRRMVTNPKCHPSLHWGPLWDLVAQYGNRTQRDGDNSKVSPYSMTGDPCGTWWHQKGAGHRGMVTTQK